jgi:hypothetical protein
MKIYKFWETLRKANKLHLTEMFLHAVFLTCTGHKSQELFANPLARCQQGD